MSGYEFVWRGRTLQTRAATPDLLAACGEAMAALMLETGVHSAEGLACAPMLKRIAFARAVMRHVPPLLWTFLSPDSRWRAGARERFCWRVPRGVVVGFLNWIEAQSREVQRVVGLDERRERRASLETVYAVLCRGYGWTLEQARELSVVEIHHYLSELCALQRRENVQQVNLMALAASAGAGHKKSVDEIKRITRDEETTTRTRDHRESARAQGKVPGAVIPLFEVANGQ